MPFPGDLLYWHLHLQPPVNIVLFIFVSGFDIYLIVCAWQGMVGSSDPMRRDLGTSPTARVNFGAPVWDLVASSSILTSGQWRRRAVWSRADGTVRAKHPSHGERGVGSSDQQRRPLRLVLVQVHCLEGEIG